MPTTRGSSGLTPTFRRVSGHPAVDVEGVFSVYFGVRRSQVSRRTKPTRRTAPRRRREPRPHPRRLATTRSRAARPATPGATPWDPTTPTPPSTATAAWPTARSARTEPFPAHSGRDGKQQILLQTPRCHADAQGDDDDQSPPRRGSMIDSLAPRRARRSPITSPPPAGVFAGPASTAWCCCAAPAGVESRDLVCSVRTVWGMPCACFRPWTRRQPQPTRQHSQRDGEHPGDAVSGHKEDRHKGIQPTPGRQRPRASRWHAARSVRR